MDEHWDFAVGEHLDRFASEHDRRESAPPVRCHDDEIAAPNLCRFDDRRVRVIVLDLNSFTRDTLGPCGDLGSFEIAPCLSMQIVVDEVGRSGDIYDRCRVRADRMEWCRNCERSHFCI